MNNYHPHDGFTYYGADLVGGTALGQTFFFSSAGIFSGVKHDQIIRLAEMMSYM